MTGKTRGGCDSYKAQHTSGVLMPKWMFQVNIEPYDEHRLNNITSWNGGHKENVSGFEFCLCSVYPKESLGCNIVKPWPPQGLVSTLRCPRCEACVHLFIQLVVEEKCSEGT